MKKNNQFDIALNSVGFVLFDPKVLRNFQTKNSLSNDLFEEFQTNSEVGDEAIVQGTIVPIYSIPPLDYKIIINTNQNPSVNKSWIKFISPSLPLDISSGKVVISDISAIMDWDYDFYNDLEPSILKQPYNTFSLEPGKYSVSIVGFCEKDQPKGNTANKGYELLFDRVKKLKKLNSNIDSDTINFSVCEDMDT